MSLFLSNHLYLPATIIYSSEERKEDKIKGKDVPEECEKVIKTEIKVEGEEKEDDDEDEANRSKKKIKLDDSLAEKDSEETNNAV